MKGVTVQSQNSTLLIDMTDNSKKREPGRYSSVRWEVRAKIQCCPSEEIKLRGAYRFFYQTCTVQSLDQLYGVTWIVNGMSMNTFVPFTVD